MTATTIVHAVICDQHDTECDGLLTTDCGWNLHAEDAIDHMSWCRDCQADEVTDERDETADCFAREN